MLGGGVMNEEQADQMINLLNKVFYKLEDIEQHLRKTNERIENVEYLVKAIRDK
jgi:hypothetical protein